MLSPPKESERLRIAVALAVLRCKPVNMTCFAYIQSLRESFPRSQSQSLNGNGDDGGSETNWKEHASKLEKECERLKQELEAMEIQMFLAKNQAKEAREATPQTMETPSTAPENQKKGKQKQVAASAPEENIRRSQVSSDLKSVLKSIENGGEASKIFSSKTRLLELLDTLFALLAHHGGPEFPQNAFLSATRRAIDAISVSLDCTVKDNMSLDRIQMLDSLLGVVIEKSLPIIMFTSDASRKTAASDAGDDITPLAAFLSQLSTTVLMPILRSFYMLSERLLATVLLEKGHNGRRSKSSADKELTGNGAKNADGRPALLAFFHGALNTTCTTVSSLAQAHAGTKLSAKASAKTREKARTQKALARNSLVELSLLHHDLLFEAIRFLDRMFVENAANATTKSGTKDFGSNPSKRSRVLRLVIKDTIWYLCSVMHAVINAEAGVSRLLDSDNFAPQCSVNSHNSQLADLPTARLRIRKKTTLESFLGLVALQDLCHESRTGGWHAMTSDMHSGEAPTGGCGGGECIDNELHGAPLRMLDKDRIQGGGARDGTGNMHDSGSGPSSSYLENNRGAGQKDEDAAACSSSGSGSGIGSIPVPAARTPVLLDDVERRMILRVVESFFNII
ncbi:hypothetical protein JR316_0001251 [Psilocybe cubensis]|uniref:Uncharacterized protein n=2 Tax=Psilocybe cubensis TaxID=181762 RepID=A0ACB8HHM6_PSICU|nr:hypothetical protein JR316_0001251 [Psilocybe cubensis]KAH9487182.1 hypothetical protein JR316_0001251 [Psilocybe cubensis]